MTSAETVCFSCTFCTAGSSQECEVAACQGQLAMGTMDGFLQSVNLYRPGYRTRCAPDSDTSCVALERQPMHSIGLERVGSEDLASPLFSTANGRCLRTG